MVVAGAWVVSSMNPGVRGFILFTVGLGLISGIMGINVSHELIHRVNNRLEPALGRAMLFTVFYGHWAIEHVAGHHARVATFEDPATAREGESFYRFWPRTVFGGFESARDIENGRLERKNLAKWGPRNRVLQYLAIQLGLVGGLALVFGPVAVPYYFLQAITAVTLLEAVNYLEHYGLVREKLPDGRYEKVTHRHSWNNSSRISNWYLFNLQRHSDHHAEAGRRYQTLRHFDDSPQLPFGYAFMVVMTFMPALWRHVMDRILGDHRSEAGREGG